MKEPLLFEYNNHKAFFYSEESDGEKLIGDVSAKVLSFQKVMDSFQFKKATSHSVTFVGADKMRELNSNYRNKKTSTDVLSFPVHDFTLNFEQEFEFPEIDLGDVVICLEKLFEQAIEHGLSPETEFFYLYTHGLLHLYGYDHEKSEKDQFEMEAKEREIMDKYYFLSETSI